MPTSPRDSRYEGFVGPLGPTAPLIPARTIRPSRTCAWVRYNVYNGAVALTPFVGVVVPRSLRDQRPFRRRTRFARVADGSERGPKPRRGLPTSYVHGRYSFAIVESVEELNLNRSNADWEIGHFATHRLSLRFTGMWQRTYGGVDIPKDQNLPHYHDLHDRAARSRFIRLGGGGSFALSKSLDLHADYTRLVWGINTHAGRGLPGDELEILEWLQPIGKFRVQPSGCC